MNKTERFPTKVSLVRFFLKGSLRFFALSMLCACGVSLLDMIGPRIISFTVDSVIGDAPVQFTGPLARLLAAAGGVEGLRAHPGLIAGAVVLTALGAAAFRYLFRLLNSMGAETMVRHTRDSLFSHILSLPFSWLSENSTGDIIQRCTSDVEMLKTFLSEHLTSFVRILVLIVMAVAFMAGISVPMTLAASLFIPAVVGFSLFFHGRIGSAFEKADTEEGKLSAIAQENLTGVRVVRAFGREIFERERFEKQNASYTSFWVHLIRLLSLYWAAGDIMTGLQLLLVTVMGAVFAVNGQITAGEYIAFVSYNAMLTWPVRMLGRVISEMSKAGISIDRLRYIMNSAPERAPKEAKLPPMDRDIRFEHVSFTYPGAQEPVLSDVSFTVPAGKTVGILGTTGSGKSTLVSLLTRLWDLPQDQGHIFIGDTDLQEIDAAYLRKNVGMVLQEPYLFSRTLAENIAVTKESAGMDAIREAAAIAALAESVEEFPSGYETFVGERGVTLSGGQKQRTAIAQMLIRKPPVMIFDDSLSAVDAETDMRIREALKSSTSSATVILIAHRVTTLMLADEILVLDNGRILERGSHNELLERNGFYRRIFDLQMQE